jgi:hypothetical protein
LLFSTESRPVLRPTQPPVQWVLWGCLLCEAVKFTNHLN